MAISFEFPGQSKECRSLEPHGQGDESAIEVKRRRLECFGHIIRNEKYRILQLVMEGKIEGRRRPSLRKKFLAQEINGLMLC